VRVVDRCVYLVTEKEVMMVSLSARVITALKTAIRREENTSQVYQDKARKMRDPKIKTLLESLAKQETAHATKLQRVLEKGDLTLIGQSRSPSVFARLALQNDDVREMGKQTEAAGVIRWAVKAEANSYRFYAGLAKLSKGLDLGEVFTRLADEELKHKARLEAVLVRL